MADRPHVVYILSDEHCAFATGYMGDPNLRTPHLDSMLAGGAGFERAYANTPICTPSRGSIFSGRYAHCGPVQFFFDVYKATAPSTATLLREAGYRTAYFGKWHCGVVRNQEPPAVRAERDRYTVWPMRTPEYHRGGFQDWYGFEVNNAPFEGFYYREHETNPRLMEKYQTDALTDLAIEYLQNYEREAPLFLVLSVEPPHFPLEAPAEFKRWRPEALATRPNFGAAPHLRGQLATYYAMVENLDWNIGRLRAALAALPRFHDDTLTVYFSDHGDFMGSHNAFNRKEYPHEESVRVPALFHWPGHIPQQGLIPGLFSLVDMLPTTLGLLGLTVPPHVQGTDFSAALRSEDFAGPDAVLLEMCGNPRWSLDFLDWRGLVTQRWKYAFFETGHELLFDLEHDPYEQNNLAATDLATCAALRQRLLALLKASREPYFDVLIEHGAPAQTPVLDVSGGDDDIFVADPSLLSPAWADMIRPPQDP